MLLIYSRTYVPPRLPRLPVRAGRQRHPTLQPPHGAAARRRLPHPRAQGRPSRRRGSRAVLRRRRAADRPAGTGPEAVPLAREEAAHAQDPSGGAGSQAAGSGAAERKVRAASAPRTFPGWAHDEKVFDRIGVAVPVRATGYGGTAYLGAGLETPRRKPRGGVLTLRQRAGDCRVGRQRVAVEYGIGEVRLWRVAAERWRDPRRRHPMGMTSVDGLHNRMYAEWGPGAARRRSSSSAQHLAATLITPPGVAGAGCDVPPACSTPCGDTDNSTDAANVEGFAVVIVLNALRRH